MYVCMYVCVYTNICFKKSIGEYLFILFPFSCGALHLVVFNVEQILNEVINKQL